MILIKYKDKITTVIEPFLQCLKIEGNTKTQYYINQREVNEDKYNFLIEKVLKANHNALLDLDNEWVR